MTRREWLTPAEVKERLSWPFSVSTIRRWIDNGDLPGLHPRRGAHRKVLLADAEAFEANGYRKVQPPDPAPVTATE